MYIKIIGYFIFLLQFVWGFSHIDWTNTTKLGSQHENPLKKGNTKNVKECQTLFNSVHGLN